MLRSLMYIALIFLFGLVIFNTKGDSTTDKLTNFINYSQCRNPTGFRVGTIDPGFNISRDDFKSYVQDAVDVWNNAFDTVLFTYDDNAQLDVNLIYDTRQELTESISQYRGQVDTSKSSLKVQEEEFKSQVDNFENKLEEFNNQVAYWNNQGGAPVSEYENLIKKQQELKTEADYLNSEAKRLNQSVDDFNSQVRGLNKSISQYNQEISLRPEEGIYRGAENQIDIFFYMNEEELVHTLIHEFGHALNLPHVDDKNSIMYPYTTAVTSLSDTDKSLLREACRSRSILERAITNLRYITLNLFEVYRNLTQ